jgi:hydrogenase expression/formation protein HypC
MCLGVPGRVMEWIDRDPVFARASIEFGGVRRTCHMACVPEAQVGDYVVVHAGLAISRIDENEARRALEELERLGLDEEIPQDQLPEIEDVPPGPGEVADGSQRRGAVS